MTHMFGAFQALDNTQQSRHTRPSIKAASDLIRGDVSGSLELLENAIFSFGWRLMIDVGQSIDCMEKSPTSRALCPF
jgi:hypothetical protein